MAKANGSKSVACAWRDVVGGRRTHPHPRAMLCGCSVVWFVRGVERAGGFRTAFPVDMDKLSAQKTASQAQPGSESPQFKQRPTLGDQGPPLAIPWFGSRVQPLALFLAGANFASGCCSLSFPGSSWSLNGRIPLQQPVDHSHDTAMPQWTQSDSGTRHRETVEEPKNRLDRLKLLQSESGFLQIHIATRLQHLPADCSTDTQPLHSGAVLFRPRQRASPLRVISRCHLLARKTQDTGVYKQPSLVSVTSGMMPRFSSTKYR